MADRVSASITIGGNLPAHLLAAFAETVRDEGLSTDWDGALFDVAELPVNDSLQLVAHEVAWGHFDALESFCIGHALPFTRWSDGYAGEWSAERVVFKGSGEAVSYGVTSGDLVMVDRHAARRLGSYEAIFAYFDAADFDVPPLTITG